MQKKGYVTPTVTSEAVSIGVFGCNQYGGKATGTSWTWNWSWLFGGSGNGGGGGSWKSFWKRFFGWL